MKKNISVETQSLILPQTLMSNVINTHAEKGRKWLSDLPDLLVQFEKSWNLTLGECFTYANFNYVAPEKLENGLEVVLKCGVPSRGLIAEANALKYYNGVGVARLLQ